MIESFNASPFLERDPPRAGGRQADSLFRPPTIKSAHHPHPVSASDDTAQPHPPTWQWEITRNLAQLVILRCARHRPNL